ncbi:MAG: hypothetical protein MUC49_22320 [Raineya sp.]|jgi:hypothetical protein|nr:hypothetical protein [Raineya sp.]
MKLQLCKIAWLMSMILIFSQHSKAQSDLEEKAPTLQVGLDGFSFSKGSLNAQLIMEIIAEKQKELKVKAIQNLFLNKVEKTGGTVYTFTDNVIRELVFEPDHQIRTKKILENTINLVFTSTYLNFYLMSLKPNSDERLHIINLACIYNPKLLKDTLSLQSKEFLNISDFSTGSELRRIYKDKGTVEFIALLLDMCSKAIREDKKLKQLGLMQIAYSETYEFMNLYNQLDNDKKSSKASRNKAKSKKTTPDKEISKEAIFDIAKPIYEDIEKRLSLCTDYIGAVNFLTEQGTFRYNSIEGIKIKTDATFLLDNIKNDIKNVIEQLEREVQQQKKLVFNVAYKDTTLTSDITNLVKVYFYIDKAIKHIESTKNPKIYADILYTIKNDFIPLIKNQAYRSPDFIQIIDHLQLFNNSFFNKILSQNNLLINFQEDIPYFLQLVSKLYQFDKTSTISEYMKLLDNIGTIFPDDDIRNALSTILKFVKDYSIVEKNNQGKEVLSFNIESFLYKLQTIKPYKLRRINFMFTVGVNNTIFKKNLVLSNGDSVINFSYVGEKIGIKWKIYDNEFWKTKNPGETYKYSRWPLFNTTYYTKKAAPKDPIISNWHLLAYGSGILYNLVNTKTQKEFNMPLIGVGTGLTFFNGLDINVSYGVPILPNEKISSKNGFYNIGFDIQFIEYYDRLKERMKNNQIQKRLTQAKINSNR